MRDTIVHFGEFFEPDVLAIAEQKAKESDLSICLGSKLTVTPASEMPFYINDDDDNNNNIKTTRRGKRKVAGNNNNKSNKKVVICNLQPTPMVLYNNILRKKKSN